MPKRKVPSLEELQKIAFTYAVNTLKNRKFGVGDLDDDAYKACMDNIVQALIGAWAAGYAEGRR